MESLASTLGPRLENWTKKLVISRREESERTKPTTYRYVFNKLGEESIQ